MRKIAVARFCRTLSTLLSSGVPILDGLEITARTSGNSVVEEAILVTRKSIERGETISAPLKETGVFPPMVTQMIAVGETTGALDTMLVEDRRLLRRRSRHGRRRPADAARADHDRVSRRRRRRHRHRDVSADLRPDQPAGGIRTSVAERDIRRKLFWLIAIRVGISTLLLGSAVFVQLTAPGTFPGEPLFLLIGVTYALNILWSLTLKWAERFTDGWSTSSWPATR